MKLINRLITHYLLQGLAMGILLAVITLFMIEKGLTLLQIGQAFGAFGLTAALLELPLGATADLHGRITVFRLSQIVSVCALVLALLFNSFPVILFAMSLMGLARALESGSIGAWQIDQFHEQGHEAQIPQWLGRLQAAQALGIALGALFGGYLPQLLVIDVLTTPTSVNLMCAALITAVHILLLPWLFHEGERTHAQNKNTLHRHIATAVKTSWQRTPLRSMMLIALLLGLVMSCIETYWQSQVQSLLTDTHYPVFGWLATGYFTAAATGPALLSAWLDKHPLSMPKLLNVILWLSAPVLFALATSQTLWSFALWYVLFMAILACINIPLQVITNQHCESESRSAIQSVVSLMIQAGAAMTAFGVSMLVHIFGISLIWQGLAVLILAIAVIRSVISLFRPLASGPAQV